MSESRASKREMRCGAGSWPAPRRVESLGSTQTHQRRMVMMIGRALILLSVLTVGITTGRANADERSGGCPSLPNWKDLRQSLSAANAHVNLILNNNMWATIVAADGTVCAVAYTGDDALEAQWLLSRVISAQKANTANRSEEHTSELQSRENLVCRLLLEKKKKVKQKRI